MINFLIIFGAKYLIFVIATIALVYFFERSGRRAWPQGTRALLSLFWDAFYWGAFMLSVFFIFSPYALIDFHTARDFVTQL